MIEKTPQAIPSTSLYLHLPWCVAKCPYCDFNSHALKSQLPESDYVHALIDDFNHSVTTAPLDAPLRSIFIGGGTPSLFSATIIEKLLTAIRPYLSKASPTEITLEANPGTLDKARFQGYHEIGINRLSLGIQSFHDGALQALGRIHNGKDGISALETAQEIGFNNINIDLMFGLPQQNTQQALADLRQAIALQPQHISWYQLTLEPNTAFYRNPPPLPPEDAIAAMTAQGQRLLEESGYRQYEISAYAKPGYACQHNLHYWQFGDYVGIGAGAHGKRTHKDTVTRMQRVRHPKAYLQKTAEDRIYKQWILTSEERIFEYMLNRLRLYAPVCLHDLTQATQCSLDSLAKTLETACTQQLITRDDTSLSVTPHGHRFLNDLCALFLP